MTSRITLESNTFKALSAKSRVDILKHLNHRKYTQSELAQLLSMKVPSVKEHLTELEKAELVKKLDEGRKWKYYELTHKAKSILHPEEKQIFIALGVFVLSAIGTGYLFLKESFGVSYSSFAEKSAVVADRAISAPMLESSAKLSPKLASEVASQTTFAKTGLITEPNYLLFSLGIIAVVALISLAYFLIKRRNMLRLLPK
jgi:DNA-binding transcriptional ArsR family regulator